MLQNEFYLQSYAQSQTSFVHYFKDHYYKNQFSILTSFLLHSEMNLDITLKNKTKIKYSSFQLKKIKKIFKLIFIISLV